MILNLTAGGFDINGIIKEYLVASGENISAGDFVTFIDEQISSTASLKTNTYTGYAIAAVKLSETKVFIAHSYGSSYYLYGTVCTISGTTVTAGTSTKLSSTASTGKAISIDALGENKVFIAYRRGDYYLYGIVCTVSGTTITKGTETKLSTNAYSAYASINVSIGSVIALSETKVFIAHCGDSEYGLYGMICTISGTTITVETDTAISTSKHAAYYPVSAVKLSETKVFIAFAVGGNSMTRYPYGIVCTISGTTITKGTETKLASKLYADTTCAVMLNSSKVLVLHEATNNYELYGVVCTISGTTITAGTDTAVCEYSGAGVNIAAAASSETEVIIAHSSGSNDKWLFMTIITISGKTITVDALHSIDEGNPESSDAANVIVLNEYITLIFHKKNDTDQSLDYLTRFTNLVKEYSNTISGVAKTSGSAGEKIKAYRPE